MNILKIDFKRAFFSKSMLFSILIGLTAVGIGMYMEPLRSALELYASNPTDITETQKFDLIYNSLNKVSLWTFAHYIYPLIMPLLCCIPFASIYIQDKNSGFNRFIIIRKSYKKYLSSRIIITFLSGFFTIFIIGCISYIFMLLLDSGEIHRSFFLEDTLFSSIYNTNFDLFAFVYILISSLMGGIYALLGLAVSSITNSKLVATIFPFIFYYSGSYILSNFDNLLFINPVILNKFVYYPEYIGKYIFIQLFLLLLFSLLIFLYKTYWSDCHE